MIANLYTDEMFAYFCLKQLHLGEYLILEGKHPELTDILIS